MKEHMIISQYISDGVGKEKRPRRARICFSGSKAGVKGKTFPDFIKVIIVIPVIKFHKVFAKIGKLEYLPAPLFKVIGVMKITTVINRGSVDPAEHYP